MKSCPQEQIYTKKYPKFSREILDRLIADPSHQPTIEALIAMKKGDFSEDNPILMLIPHMNDQNSVDYVNSGNFGLLLPEVPGYAQ